MSDKGWMSLFWTGIVLYVLLLLLGASFPWIIHFTMVLIAVFFIVVYLALRRIEK